MPRMVANSRPPTSPIEGSSPHGGATSAAQASAATSDEMATLAPNDDDVKGAASERYQSTDTLEMARARKTSPSAAKSCPRLPSTRGNNSASADQPTSANTLRTMKEGTFK